MPHPLPAPPSLAERRRTATRLELARIAAGLITKHGFDGVTVEAIAEAAGISARTFYRYFPAKEDVVVPLAQDGTATLAEQLAARPPGEPLITAVPAAFAAMLAAPGRLTPRESAAFTRMLTTHAALRGRWLDTLQDSEQVLAAVIAARLGLKPDAAEARLAAVAVMSALRIAMEHWAESRADADIVALADEALRFFADGAMLQR
jgi:AcrR family transcriptional regulator